MSVPVIFQRPNSVFFKGLPPIPKGETLYADGLVSYYATREEYYDKDTSDQRFVNVDGDTSTGDQSISQSNDGNSKFWQIKYTHPGALATGSGFGWYDDFSTHGRIGGVLRVGTGTDQRLVLYGVDTASGKTFNIVCKVDGTFQLILDGGATYPIPSVDGDIMLKKYSIVKGQTNNIIQGTYNWFDGVFSFKNGNGNNVFELKYDGTTFGNHIANFHNIQVRGIRTPVNGDDPTNKTYVDNEIEKAKIMGMFF